MKNIATLYFLAISALLSAQKPELMVRQGGHFSNALLVCFSPDERQALSAEGDNLVLWDLGSGRFIRSIPLNEKPSFLGFSTDGASATATLTDGTFNAWDLASGVRLWSKTRLSALEKNEFPFSGTPWKKTWNEPNGPLQLSDFPTIVTRQLPNLAQAIGQTQMPVTDFVFSKDKRLVVVALGEPTKFWAVTPGLPANRSGKGGLLVWDVQNDRLLHRMADIPEIINSADISADGKRCLTACSDQTVRLWDLSSGKELRRMQRQPAMEHNFRITPDFRRLVMTNYDGAFKTWDLNERTELAVRPPAFDETSIYSAADFDAIELSADGKQLLSASRDFSLKGWNTKPLELLGKLEDRHNCLWVSTAMAISPDGKKALVGSSPEWRVMSWHLPTEIPRKEVRRFVTNNAGRDTVGVVWGDKTIWGDVEINGDMVIVEPDYFNVSLWDLEKRQSLQVYQTNVNDWHPVSSVHFSSDGRLAVATVLDRMLAWNLKTADRVVNAQGKDYFHAVCLESAPHLVATIEMDSLSATVWNLSDGKIVRRLSSASSLTAAGFHPSGKWLCTLDGSGNLTEWDVQTGEMRRKTGGVPPGQSIRYAPGDNLVAIRSQGQVTVCNLETGRIVLHPGGADAVMSWNTENFFEGHKPEQVNLFQFSTDGSRAVSANYDGTLRFWSLQTGQELATVYFPGEKDWIVKAPNGLFDATPGAMQRMYFVVGTEVIDLEQLKERYFEPGLLQKILGRSDEPQRSVSGFDSVALYPKIRLQVDSLKNTLRIALSPRNGGVGKVSVFVNGKEIIEDANPASGVDKVRDTIISIDLTAYARYFFPDSLNTISIRAYNEAGWLKSAPQNVEYRLTAPRSKGAGSDTGAAPVLFKRDPALYVVAVGTSNYSGTQLDLQYAGKDARDMAVALNQIGKQLFSDSVFVTLLTTDTSSTALQPTKDQIRKTFEAIKKRAKAEDILVVYFSGHGISYGDADRALFYYLTKEIGSFDLSDAGVREQRAVSSNELTHWINDIPALKQVLILDACNSGKILENLSLNSRALNTSQIRALDRMKDRTGMFVLTGSAADKVSYEAGEYGQGLLTYSILQFVKSLGSQGEKPVDVMKMFQYATDKVPELARGIGGIQTPLPAVPSGGASFDIGIVNEKVSIPLAEKKKVFIRSAFQSENLGDELNLVQETENYFQEMMARGEQAKLIYLDIGAYENGYALRGRYRVEGKVVKLRVNLFRNGKALSPTAYEVEGRADAVPELVKLMLQKVSPLLKQE